MTKNVAILGSTGSIGTQTLEVISDLQRAGEADFNVTGLVCGTNVELLIEQAEKYSPKVVGIKDEKDVDKVAAALPGSISILHGTDGLLDIASLEGTKLIVNALVGFVGLEPTLAAINADKRLLLANKESLVVGGSLVNQAIDNSSATVMPIDSEHNAIYQSLQSGKPDEVERLIITASGGPFRDTPLEEIDRATPEEALDHPNWDMGHRITCDSASMVNKGLEVIEAHWLFGLPFDRIDAVIHPQSFVHSLVQYRDGSIIAELGDPDMKVPIQYTLTYPDRMPNNYHETSMIEIASLDFRKLEPERYPAFDTVVTAGKQGGNRPAAINGADEALIEEFLEENITFGDIARGLGHVLDQVVPVEDPSLEDLRNTDRWARKKVRQLVEDKTIGV